MSNTEKGEWRLVTAEGCEDGSLAALHASHAEGVGPRIGGIRCFGLSVYNKAQAHWEDGALVWARDTSPVQVHLLLKNCWQVFHPEPKPLTATDVAYVVRAAQGMLIGKPLSSVDDGRLRGLLGRPLPEFPRRIPFAERLPELGVQVVYSTVDGDVMLGFRTGPTGSWMKSGCYTTDTDACLWWHPIAGPESEDDE